MALLVSESLYTQESLGGDAKTFMVANVSSEAQHMSQTFKTLEFAQLAKRVRNQVCLPTCSMSVHGACSHLDGVIPLTLARAEVVVCVACTDVMFPIFMPCSLQAVVNEDTKGNAEALQRELDRRAAVISDLRRSLQSLEAAAANRADGPAAGSPPSR
jgi:uncharacterized protein (DUF58 family)